MTEAEVKNYYEQDARIYNESRFESSHGLYIDSLQKSAVFGLLRYCNGKNILELGSGTGRFTRELAKRGAHVVCVDVSRNMHRQSRRFLPPSMADFFTMSGSRLGFANGSFDACVTVNMMSHVECVPAILSEVNRVLREGGIFVANFPNMSGVYFPIGSAVNFFNHSLRAPVYSRWYAIDTILRFLRSQGLVPVEALAHLVFPGKLCPDFLFESLKRLDAIFASSWTRFLLGDVFIKCVANGQMNKIGTGLCKEGSECSFVLDSAYEKEVLLGV